MPWDNSRPTHVPKRVRDAALLRDDHQCTATLQIGGRCPERTHLEAHETDQWEPGRTITVDDVIMLCPFHHNIITQQQAARARRLSPPHRDTRPPARHPGLR